jgi:hypothetical protein
MMGVIKPALFSVLVAVAVVTTLLVNPVFERVGGGFAAQQNLDDERIPGAVPTDVRSEPAA